MQTANPASAAAPTRPWKFGFWSLIVTQFQGAFSDNALKNLVVLLIVGAGLSEAKEHAIGELVGALFSLPFILFSMTGGFMADRFSKRTICIGVKVFEIFVMTFATAGLAWKNLPMQLAAVFFMGVHSAFFGPSKYGSLPELLDEHRLSWGNGVLELGTFLAIIFGTVAASVLADKLDGHQGWSGVVLILLAVCGLAASLGITKVPAADPNRRYRPNFIGELWSEMREAKKDRPLALALLGNTYFFFLAALLMLNLFFYGSHVLHLTKLNIGLLNVAVALGIGFGSLAAGYLSRGRIEIGLIPLGAAGLAVTSSLMALPGLSFTLSMVGLALLGLTGGFFIVPISALLQHRPARERKGRVLATANLLSFIGVFAASGAHYVLAELGGLRPGSVFMAGGVMTVFGTFAVVKLVPDSLTRLAAWSRTLFTAQPTSVGHAPALPVVDESD
jgi:acyl-[acyl-carrier-protein]-phospholipid O-acyltransferase/long-chain-fatty-acid--[acyl-carrier-protein] ligase